MCIIIHRPAGKSLDKDELATAILNNPDGYGLSVADGKGGLSTFRTSKEPDPDVLHKMLEKDFKNENVLLHLRYTTAGAKNLRNAHPFPILEKRKHGVDIRMGHNGTIYKYKQLADKGESDTRVFVRLFVRPLFERLIKGMSSEEILSDPFVKEMLEEQLPSASVLILMDGYGNKLICNEDGNGGFTKDDIYHSNKYSYDPEHRNPKQAITHMGSYGQNYWSGWGDDNNYKTVKSSPVTKTSTNKGALLGDTGTGQELFTEKYKFHSKEDLFALSDQTIEDICEESPGEAASLIKELLYELQLKTNENKSMKPQLSALKTKIGELQNEAA